MQGFRQHLRPQLPAIIGFDALLRLDICIFLQPLCWAGDGFG